METTNYARQGVSFIKQRELRLVPDTDSAYDITVYDSQQMYNEVYDIVLMYPKFSGIAHLLVEEVPFVGFCVRFRI